MQHSYVHLQFFGKDFPLEFTQNKNGFIMRNESDSNFPLLSKIGGKQVEIAFADSNLDTHQKNQENPVILVTQNLLPLTLEIEKEYGISGF